MNILAIGAHPDDIEIGCAATLAKHSTEGDHIFGVIVTRGENGGDVEIRKNEALAAAKVLDMNLIFGNFPDGDVKESRELVTFLDNIIKANKIEVIYTHSLNDRHQDHRAVSRASMSASRNVQEVYCYEAVSLISSFTPQIFVDVTETFGYKISALRKFESQIERTFVEGLEGIARFRASQTRLAGRLCEAFEAYKILRNDRSPQRLEMLDLKNQIEKYREVFSGMEESFEKNYFENPELVDSIRDLKNLSSTNPGYKKINHDALTPITNYDNIVNVESNLDEIKEIKNILAQQKSEMEKLKKEIAGYREALLLKKEIALYKEALEKASNKKLEKNI